MFDRITRFRDPDGGIYVYDSNIDRGETRYRKKADRGELNPESKNFKSRKLFESLVFFDYPFFVIMPVFYLGQLLGFIFVNFQPPGKPGRGKKKKSFSPEWNQKDFDIFRKMFFDLSVEFGPLLYNSLIFHFISEIVAHYSSRRKAVTVHEAIIGSLPKILNTNMIAFWAFEDSKGGFNESPDNLFGFCEGDKTKELSFLQADQLTTSLDLRKYYTTNSPAVLHLVQNEDIFGLPGGYVNKKSANHCDEIPIKSALIIPIRDKELRKERFREGIYIFFFEYLSPYILQRNALDISREISGIFKIILMGEKGRSEVLRHADKAATNAICSRNFSHHVGSHVMPRSTVERIIDQINDSNYLNGYFSGYDWSSLIAHVKEIFISINEKIKDQKANQEDIEKCCKDFKLFINAVDNKSGEYKEKSTKLSRIINCLKSRLDEYNQKKSDFMAEIATEPLISTKTVDFYKDLVLAFRKNTLLIGNLCKNEGLGYRSNDKLGVQIKCFIDNKQQVAKFECHSNANHITNDNDYPYIAHCVKDNCYTNSDSWKEKFYPLDSSKLEIEDKSIAVPGPLGEFAFYSFLENFIRNAAKHNTTKWNNEPEATLNIFIELSEISDKEIDNIFYERNDNYEFYKVEIYDTETDPKKELEIEILNGQKKRKEKASLTKFINYQIRQPIIESDGTIRKGSWGIGEMKIMANLLSGKDDPEMRSRNLRVKTSKKPIDGINKDVLVYEFKVMKPKKVAYIGSVPKGINKTNYNNAGIWFFKDVSKYMESITSGRSIASYDFTVLNKKVFNGLKQLNDPVNKDKYERCLALLSFRTIVINDNAKCNKDVIVPGAAIIETASLKYDSPDDLIGCLWKAWINSMKKNKQYTETCLHIYLQQDDNQKQPTQQYTAIAAKLAANDDYLHVSYKGSIQPCSHSNVLLFDRHAGAIDSMKERLSSLRFYEIIEKNNPDFTSIFNPPVKDSSDTQEFIYRLFEAGLTKILIVDERITEIAYDDILKGISNINIKNHCQSGTRIGVGSAAGVYICTHLSFFGNDSCKRISPVINDRPPMVKVSFGINGRLFNKKCDGSSMKIAVQLNNSEPQEIENIDVLIIHQGIVEHKDFSAVEEKSFGLLITELRKRIPYVIVDSGRGIPTKLDKNAKFLPFSLLNDYVGKDNIAKYSLTNTIMPLIRRTNDSDKK